MAWTDKLKIAAILGPTAAVAALSFTAPREGESLTPYRDKLAGNIWTVCYGDTRVQMRRYTSQECKALLANRLADYAGPVRDMTPGFGALTDGQKVAAVDFAYNAGVDAYRSSTLRRMYSAGQFPQACDQYLAWKYVRPNGRDRIDCSKAENANICGGIWRRRQAERAICRGEEWTVN